MRKNKSKRNFLTAALSGAAALAAYALRIKQRAEETITV